ncbi:MAG TPA: hypothetical protein VNV82_25065 [Bryobacteraceae bacterium]|nr:hypothetical protein [Bryobacteraceae bacterium]
MKRLPISGLILIASPAIALALLLYVYGVDVPFWDQWSIVGLAEAFHLHILTFGQLFAQYNEHRLLFPRVLMLGIDALAHGNVKWDLAALWLLAAVVLLNVYRLARLTLQGTAVRLLTGTFLASLLIFSPIQYENWLWGMQVDMLLPVACLSTALVVLYSNSGKGLKLAIASALATIAGYSYLNGLSCWVLLIPAVLQQFKGKPAKLWAASIWIALTTLNVAAFFYHYRFLSSRPEIPNLLAHSELVIISFLGFLGAPLSLGTGINEERLAHFIGAAVVLLAVPTGLRLIDSRRRPGMLWRCLPWLTIGAYSLVTAVIVTLGRATSSPQRLLESRYTSFSVYLLVALIFLFPILFAPPDAPPSGWKRASIEGSVAMIVFLQLFTALYAIGQMKETRTDRLESKACLAFFNLIDDPCQTQRLDWDPMLLKQRVQSLERLDFFHPPLVQSPDLRLLAGSADPLSKQFGVFESLTNAGSGFYRASGSGAADAVVLSYVGANSAPVAFAMADWMKVNASHNPTGWEKWFELPQGADRIQAWAYDALAGRAFLLFGEQRASGLPVTEVRFMGTARGFLDTVDSGDVLMMKGWAVLLSQHKPADMTLLTCGDNHAIVAAGQPWQIRPDVVRELGDGRFLKSGWQIAIPPGKLPQGCEVKAWAYDDALNEAGLLTDLTKLGLNIR